MSAVASPQGELPSPPFTHVLSRVSIYLGAFWTWAGIAKALSPEAAYAFTAQVVGGGMPAKFVIVGSVIVETALGLALLTRALGSRAGIMISLVLLSLFSTLLIAAKAQGGGALACGCYAFFATDAASVDGELWINGIHVAILAALLAVHSYLGRRQRVA